MRILKPFLFVCVSTFVAGGDTTRTREEAKAMLDDFERRKDEILQRDQLREAASRKRWFEEPRQSLYSMAHADDLTSYPNDGETRELFAPHALELAESETDFMPLRVYALVGFDLKNPDFARRVIQKAIRLCPAPAELLYAQMLVPLINLNRPVAELQDRPFFARLASDPNQHESVREAATAVVEEIDRKTSGGPGQTSPLPEDAAKSADEGNGKTASKSYPPESERLWLIAAAFLILGGGVVWRLIAGRR